ncbi:anthocyanidin 3-O-glucosyltransferase 4-like isoform X2 [Solanum tuberosum]|uniref:anthocyanidin 3-O-glucosyltransferase 4-like isoform X2 n=1 Tax=Solanum tuberosum TaxID=4113 RepID=UPI00073A0CDD|nr:PREDICTED: anthocyanidin 3-O-glucosyltransferase 4-like isoform X2 [Solanum tuberosum]
MAAQKSQLHFVLVPLMSPGHLIPMVDLAKLLAHHGVIVSIISTPLNTIRFKSGIDSSIKSGLQIRVHELKFPAVQVGLPEGCENMDSLPSRDSIRDFFLAASMLQKPFEELFSDLKPSPCCIISGKNMAWTVDSARLPHRIELTKAQLPENLNPGSPDLVDVRNKMVAAESISDGIIVNTFEELELDYVKEFKKIKSGKVWCIGPVSACNKSESEKAARGKNVSLEQNQCIKWLDLQEPNSVVYASLGSICGLTCSQLVELGLGLEASNRPFLWVLRGGEKSKELEKWIEEEKFEERIQGRGFLIKGWSPQILVLSHPSVGAFLTHCGWNSTLEGCCSGLPIITCPLFAEQFINEKLITQVLGTGVSVGVKAAVAWGMEEKSGLVMKREGVKNAIETIFDEGVEGEDRRRKAKEIAKMAESALEEDGSSYINIETLIHDIMRQSLSSVEASS